MEEKIRIAFVSPRGISNGRSLRVRQLFNEMLVDRGLSSDVALHALDSEKIPKADLSRFSHFLVFSTNQEKILRKTLPKSAIASIHRLPELGKLSWQKKSAKLESIADGLAVALGEKVSVLNICRFGIVRSNDVANALRKAVEEKGISRWVSIDKKGIEGKDENQLEAQHLFDADHIILCDNELGYGIKRILMPHGLKLNDLRGKIHQWSIGVNYGNYVRKETEKIADEISQHLRKAWALKKRK